MFEVDPSLLSAESLARAAVILAVGILLLVSSLISIIVLLYNKTLHNCIGYYLISLSTADLLCALIIIPLSFYSAIAQQNRDFLHDDSLICRCTAYLQIVLLSSTIYIFAWIGVDRYAAFMKPSRYESEHTLTRCKCWIAFSWITAILIACPILIAKMEVNYYRDFELCILNWSSTMAYSVTLAVLVLLPSICTILFTSTSIITALQKTEELEDSQRAALELDQNFVVTLFVVICFTLSWSPIVILQFLPSDLIDPTDTETIRFIFMWLAIGGSSSKLLIYMFINPEFRRTFFAPCTGEVVNDDDDEEFGPRSRGLFATLCCCYCQKLCCCCCLHPSDHPMASPARSEYTVTTQNVAINSNRVFIGTLLVTLGLVSIFRAQDNTEMASQIGGRIASIFSVVYVTVPSIEVGKKIAHEVVKSRLAACVNIVPGVTSIYEWKGKLEEDNELLLIIKTKSDQLENLKSSIVKIHPYEVPEFISLPIETGSDPYLKWIENQVGEKKNEVNE
uniref:G-protein coupled receptors family 1 profile domain-containing protein n=2 Tax=Acrobeloides nanus TaxID=290746 RepID=A0A914CYP5_9BILA